MTREQETVNRLLQQSADGDSRLACLAGYRLVRELGRGGMGAVYLIESLDSQDKAAIKVVLNDRFRQLFNRETLNSLSLNHPNIVKFRDGGEIEGDLFLLMEFCEGGSLADLLRSSPLSPEEAMSIMENILDGLEYAHNTQIANVQLADGSFTSGQGLVHRDLKPANVLFVGQGENRVAKISDLGFAKVFELAGLSGMTATGDIAGTPQFMPRQQVIDFKYAKPDVDVWAAAACLYMMLTQRSPREFGQGDPWVTIQRTNPVPIRQRNPHIPDKLAAVIDLALNDSQELHFANIPSFRSALKEALQPFS